MDTYAQQPRIRYRLATSDINQTKRPQLARAIKAGRCLYALTEIPPRLQDDGRRIYVLETSITTATLMRDEIIDGAEQIHSFIIPLDGMKAASCIMLETEMMQLASLKAKADEYNMSHRRRGRPRKYFSQDIQKVIMLHDGGMSVRKIAREMKMSPTTVQKFLDLKGVID